MTQAQAHHGVAKNRWDPALGYPSKPKNETCAPQTGFVSRRVDGEPPTTQRQVLSTQSGELVVLVSMCPATASGLAPTTAPHQRISHHRRNILV